MAQPPLGRLLIVDDEVELMTALAEMLAEEGYETKGVASGGEALEALREQEFDLLLTDLMMPIMDGIALLRAALAMDPHLAGIIMTGQGTVQTAVEAMKVGAFDYVLKPFKLNAVLPVLARAMDVRQLRLENVQLRETVAMYELAQAIAFTLDLNTILNKVADAALQQCQADEVSIMLPTGEEDGLHVAVVRGEPRGHILGKRVPMEQGIAGWVARHREWLLLRGEVNDRRFAPLQPRPDIRAAISMPMLVGNKLVGVLNVNATHGQPAFTPGQVKALTILTGIASPALEAAALFDQLQASEKKFRALIENAPDAITLLGPDGAVRYDSPAAQGLLGYGPDELLGTQVLERIHPDDLPATGAVLQRLVDTPGAKLPHTFRFRHKSGEWRWLEAVGSNLLAEPSVQAIVVNYRDITERKRAEDALRLSDEILQRVNSLVMVADAQGAIVYVSPSVKTMLGYEAADLLGDAWWNLSREDPSEREREKNYVARAARGEAPIPEQPYERRVLTRDRQPCWIVWRDARGSGDVVIGVGHDITERKQAEEQLRQAEVKYRTLVEQLPAIVYGLTFGEAAWTTYISPQVESLLGLSQAEWLADPDLWIKQLHPDDRERVLAAIGQAAEATGQPLNLEYRVLARDGRVLWFNNQSAVVHDEAGGPIYSYGIMFDITERKQREHELEAIAQVSAALRVATTRAEMLPVILNRVADLLQADGAGLAMRDPVTGETKIELARGAWATVTGEHRPPGEGVSGRVIATGQPYLNNDTLRESDSHFYRPDLLGDIRAVACVPLVAHEQTVGVLWVGRKTAITEAEVRLLTAVADMAANAIHRATLHEQTEQRLQRLDALHTIDLAITASTDSRVTLDVLLDQVTSRLGVDAADILLLNPYLQILEYAAGRGFRSNGVTRSRLRLGEGHAGRAALERRIVSVPDWNRSGFMRAALLANEGFAAYYAAPLVAKGQVKGVLEVFHRAPLAPDPEWQEFLKALGAQAAIAIDNAELFEGLQRSNAELMLAYDTTLEGWSRALDLRDKETEGHTQRVTEMTLRLAAAMGLRDEALEYLRRGALLHDIGKMGIPDSILHKPGPLTEDEWAIMREHPVYAHELLAPIAYLRPALDIPYCHHEKWDGTGYPRGLKGEQIPLAARIFTAADVWDALRSDRPYRAAWPEEKVREHLRAEAGTHFDPQVVEAFLRVIDDE